MSRLDTSGVTPRADCAKNLRTQAGDRTLDSCQRADVPAIAADRVVAPRVRRRRHGSFRSCAAAARRQRDLERAVRRGDAVRRTHGRAVRSVRARAGAEKDER